MTRRSSSDQPALFPVGTKVVTRTSSGRGEIPCPAGTVGEIVHSPVDGYHHYRVRFLDLTEASFLPSEIELLTAFKEGDLSPQMDQRRAERLRGRVILQCVVGSRAFGLADEDSDIDRRGVYLPTADEHWSLEGVPPQIEFDASQEIYWELEKFLRLALKSNPNILESLYSPLIEKVTPMGRRLIDLRECFLSRLVYQTYSGYVVSQFRKMQADIRSHGVPKWKHVMHLIRLLLAGIVVLREARVPIQVGDARDRLLAIKRGEVAFEEVDRWRLELHQQLEQARELSTLPERPDYATVNQFLIDARHAATGNQLP